MTPRPKRQCRREKFIRPSAPYTLVLYEAGTTLGVVSTKDLPPGNIKKGMTVSPVCNPIDWPPHPVADDQSAIIVEFGHDIEYLYSLHVTAKGKIVKATLTDEALAKKRELKKLEVESNIRKEAAESEANNDVRGLENLFSEPDGIASEVEESSADHPHVGVDPPNNSQKEDAIEVEGGSDYIVIHSPETEKSKENESAAKPSSNSQANENPCTSRVEQPLSKENLKAQCPADAETCPIINILAGASPSKLNFIKKVCNSIVEHINPTENQENLETPGSSRKSGNGSKATIDFSNLECHKAGLNKFELVDRINIFIHKDDRANIPVLVPHPQGVKFLRKPPQKENAMYPREMVAHLLKLLIPKDIIQKCYNSSAIPKDIVQVIKTFINLRLPPSDRLTDSMINTYIRDNLKTQLRDRKTEAEKRQDESYTPRKASTRKERLITVDLDRIPFVEASNIIVEHE